MAIKGGGGSLLGKADATLVQGSFREAAADRPVNLSGLYQRRADKFDDFLGMVSEAFDTQTKLDKEIKIKTDKTMADLEENIFSGKMYEGYQDESYRAATSVVKEIEDFTGDKNSLEFKKLQQKLTRLADVASKNEEIFTKLATSNLSHIGSGDELKLFNQIANDYNTGNNVSNVTYDEEKGDYVFTLKEDSTVLGPTEKPLSMTMSELQKKLNTKDPAGPLQSIEILNDVAKNVNNRDWDESYQNDVTNMYKKIFDDPNKKHNVMNEPLPGKDYSLYEAIAGKDENIQAEIFDALVAVKFDYDGDGPDTINEYNNLTSENIQKLKNAIKDGPESNDIVAKMMTKYAGEHSYNIGENLRKEKEPKGGGGYFTYSFAPNANDPSKQLQISPLDAQKAYDALQKKTGAWQGAQGYYARTKSGKYIRYDSRADYKKDVKNGKLVTNEAGWKKVFGEDSIWNAERVIDENRVRELETATMIRSGGGKKYD